jgi:hypothetical protein
MSAPTMKSQVTAIWIATRKNRSRQVPRLPGPHHRPPPSPAPGSPPPAHVYGRRVNPEHNGVLTYYLVELTGGPWSAEELRTKPIQTKLCELFDVPSDSLDIRVELKEQNLAKYEIASITLDSKLTFTVWVHNDKDFDVYYCGMYEPGSRADKDMQILKSPPELPAV